MFGGVKMRNLGLVGVSLDRLPLILTANMSSKGVVCLKLNIMSTKSK